MSYSNLKVFCYSVFFKNNTCQQYCLEAEVISGLLFLTILWCTALYCELIKSVVSQKLQIPFLCLSCQAEHKKEKFGDKGRYITKIDVDRSYWISCLVPSSFTVQTLKWFGFLNICNVNQQRKNKTCSQWLCFANCCQEFADKPIVNHFCFTNSV